MSLKLIPIDATVSFKDAGPSIKGRIKQISLSGNPVNVMYEVIVWVAESDRRALWVTDTEIDAIDTDLITVEFEDYIQEL